MTTVLYHSADYDGIFSREIAKKFCDPANTEFIGWNFGDPLVVLPENSDLIVMDLPIDKPFGLTFAGDMVKLADGTEHPIAGMDWSRMTWIDHHKSAIDTHPPIIPGYRIDGVAACRLAFQWFYLKSTQSLDPLPVKEAFLERQVMEPWAVRLAGEYDIWDKRDRDVDTLQYGLRTMDEELKWDLLTSLEQGTEAPVAKYVNKVLAVGDVAYRYARKVDEDLVSYRSFQLKWEGLTFLCLNTGRFNSMTFAALDKPETGHDALLGFCWSGKCWTVSLYHAAHRKDIDLSEIAVRHGGGGHKGACGFVSPALPFEL